MAYHWARLSPHRLRMRRIRRAMKFRMETVKVILFVILLAFVGLVFYDWGMNIVR